MKIIGHRGAGGLVTENTLESFQKAINLGVDAVEFDVWTSKDGFPVVSHDASLVRLTGDPRQIPDMTINEIKQLRTSNGYKLPTGSQALKFLKNTPVILEIKDFSLSGGVLDLLENYKKMDISVTSFRHSVLAELHKKHPDLKIYAATSTHPIGTVSFIKRHGLYGLTLNYHLFNPLTYWQAKRNNIRIMLYPLNSPKYVWFLKKLGVDIDICTDYPDRYLS